VLDEVFAKVADVQTLDPSFELEGLAQFDPALHFARWRSEAAAGLGDPDATACVLEILAAAAPTRAPLDLSLFARGELDKKTGERAPPAARKKPLVPGSSAHAEAVTDAKWEIRKDTHDHVRAVARELVGRIRWLRYFQAILDEQTAPRAGCAILSCCGHSGELGDVQRGADAQECRVAGCKAPVRPTSVVPCESLAGGRDAPSETCGSKLRDLVAMIKGLGDERVLVFVQFDDLMEATADALRVGGVDAQQLKGSVHQKTGALGAFQREEGARVLLLNVGNESAAGANLTMASHCIFLHPILAESGHLYKVCWGWGWGWVGAGWGWGWVGGVLQRCVRPHRAPRRRGRRRPSADCGAMARPRQSTSTASWSMGRSTRRSRPSTRLFIESFYASRVKGMPPKDTTVYRIKEFDIKKIDLTRSLIAIGASQTGKSGGQVDPLQQPRHPGRPRLQQHGARLAVLQRVHAEDVHLLRRGLSKDRRPVHHAGGAQAEAGQAHRGGGQPGALGASGCGHLDAVAHREKEEGLSADHHF
jgi:hypothetical protein